VGRLVTRPSRRGKFLPLNTVQFEAGTDNGADGIDWDTGDFTPIPTPFGVPALTYGTPAEGTDDTAIRTDATIAPPTFDELLNVDTTGKADGDTPLWDAGSSTWIVGAPSGGGGVTVEDEGTPLATTATTLDFVGAGVTATGAGATKTITIAGGSGLTIEEVDGSPTVSATKLVLPNGTLGVVGTVATYTPAGGGGLAASFVGKNAIGASWQTMGVNRIYCKSITLAATSELIAVSAYMRPSTDNLATMIASVMDDNAGAPGKLVGFSGFPVGNTYLSNSSSMPGAGRWVHLPIGATLAAGTYWIAISASAGVYDLAYDGSGSDKYFSPSGSYATGAYPTAWAITTTAQDFSIRARILA
jgi:hypothetical protein